MLHDERLEFDFNLQLCDLPLELVCLQEGVDFRQAGGHRQHLQICRAELVPLHGILRSAVGA